MDKKVCLYVVNDASTERHGIKDVLVLFRGCDQFNGGPDMSALILLSLPLSLLIVVSLVSLAILDVALRGPWFAENVGPRCSGPLVAGLAAVDLLKTAACLTGEVARGEARLSCPDTHFVPQVTDIEARAIAGEIRRNGAGEVHRVLQQSRSRAGHCPMHLTDGLCACAVVRPLDCLGRCFAGADSPEWAKGLGRSFSVAFRDHLESHQTNASTQRLDDALLKLLDQTPGSIRPSS